MINVGSERTWIVTLVALVAIATSAQLIPRPAWAQANEPTVGSLADGRLLRADDAAVPPPFDALLEPVLAVTRDDYGFAVVSADFDGDGFDDWAVGYPQADEVRVFLGGLHHPYQDPSEGDEPVLEPPLTGSLVVPTVISGPAGSRFGHSLAAAQIAGSASYELVIGAPGSTISVSGDAFVVWSIAANDFDCPGPPCQQLPRPESGRRGGDQFGWSVAATDDRIAVGAPRWYESPNGPRLGRVDLFEVQFPLRSLDPRARMRRRLSKPHAPWHAVPSVPGSGGTSVNAFGGISPVAILRAGVVGQQAHPPASLGEQLGESVAFCDFGVTRLAAGAIGADRLHILDLDGAVLSTILDPAFGGTYDGAQRPEGLFGSSVVCGDFTNDAADEIAVGAVIRDWPASAGYADSPRADGGAVFLYQDVASTSPFVQLLPAFSGEYVGYALAVARIRDTATTPDARDALVVGIPRFNHTEDTTFLNTHCEQAFVNGAVLALDFTSAPGSSLILTEANLQAWATTGFVRHRVFGPRCDQLGGAVAAGDLNGDGWSEILTSSNVDPNEDFLRDDNTLGRVWIFTTNDAEADEVGNVRDADDDDDCFADIWEDRSEDGVLGPNETSPFRVDVNAMVKNLAVTCGTPCLPEVGELTVSFKLNRACIALNDPRVEGGPGVTLRVTLTLSDGDGVGPLKPVSGDLALLNTSPAGGIEDLIDPLHQIVTWNLTEGDLDFPNEVPVQAVFDIVNPVVFNFPGRLDVDVRIDVLNAGGTLIKEARGTFATQLVGQLDDNVDGPETQDVFAVAQPSLSVGVDSSAQRCRFNGDPFPCLPNTLLPGVASLRNTGQRDLQAGFDLVLPLPPTALRCPGAVAASCFPTSGDCTTTSQNATSARCRIGEDLTGNTSQAAPDIQVDVIWQISDAKDPSVTLVPKLERGSVTLAAGNATPLSTIPLALPLLDIASACEGPPGNRTPICAPGGRIDYQLTASNIGDAATGPGVIVFELPQYLTCFDPSPGACAPGCTLDTLAEPDEFACAFSDIPAHGEHPPFNIELRVDESLAPGIRDLEANALAHFATRADPVFTTPANDLSLLGFRYEAVRCVDTADPADTTCDVGDLLQYDVVLESVSSPAFGAGAIEIDLPAHTSCTGPICAAGNAVTCTGTSSPVTCSFAGVDPGDQILLTLDLTVENTATGLVLANDARLKMPTTFEIAEISTEVDVRLAPVVRFDPNNATPAREGGEATTAEVQLDVMLDAATNLTVTVDYQLVDGTATEAGGDYAADSGTLTFVPGDTVETITVVVHGDEVAELAETFTVELSNPSRATFETPSDAKLNVPVTITDDDAAGVTIAESGGATAVTESGETDTYTIVLTSEPTAAVTVTVMSDGQTAVAPSPLTFTALNWDAAQAVTVTAVDDDVLEGFHPSTIVHAVTSVDATYDGILLTGSPVTVAITDND